MQREKLDPWDDIWNLFVDNPQSSQYLEMSRFLTASSPENAQACAQALSDFMLVYKKETQWWLLRLHWSLSSQGISGGILAPKWRLMGWFPQAFIF